MSNHELKLPDPGGKVIDFKLKPPVHVAVLCPPNSAITALLNKMGSRGGMFVLMSQVPLQVSSLAKANGQANVQLWPMLVFAIQKDAFESWLKCKYEETMMYAMDDIMNDQILDRG